jgi:hypothetical protein
LSVMVTFTVRPTIRYSPLTISCEKRPDRSSPRRIASFSLAAFLASSEEGSTVVAMLKVLATICFLPCSHMAPRSGSTGHRRQPDKTCHPLPSSDPGRAGLAGPVPRQLGAAGRAGGLPLRPWRPLASVRASSSSLIPVVCRRRPSTNRSSPSVRWYPLRASVPSRSFLARLRNAGSVAARLARSLNTFSRIVPLGFDRHGGVSLAPPAPAGWWSNVSPTTQGGADPAVPGLTRKNQLEANLRALTTCARDICCNNALRSTC